MLINCVAYQEGKKLDNIPAEEISNYLQRKNCFVWVALKEVNKRLAAWAAIFAIATAFVGIWGMNFEHMPELKWKYGYPVSLGIVSIICVYLYYRFKKSGWL